MGARGAARLVVAAALWVLAAVWTALQLQEVAHGFVGFDSVAYHRPWVGGLYDLEPLTYASFNYSPAFAQATWPLTWLPWPVFAAVWAAGAAGVYLWLARPLGWLWGPPVFVLLATQDIRLGNIAWLLALSAALGLRHPAAWALPVLTKVTPGVGALWFAFRREWRQLAIAGGGTLGVVGVSLLFGPGLWLEWLEHLTRNAGGGSTGYLWLQLVLAVALLGWAAPRGHRWAVPVAMYLASPIGWIYSAGILLAVPRLATQGGGEDTGADGGRVTEERREGVTGEPDGLVRRPT